MGNFEDMKSKLAWVVVLLVLCLDTSFAAVASAGQMAAVENQAAAELCARDSKAKALLNLLPNELRGPVESLAAEHGETLLTMIEKNTGVNRSSMMDVVSLIQPFLGIPTKPLKSAQPAPSVANDAVALIELERNTTPSDCIFLGVMATICCLISTLAVYHSLNFASYFKKVDDSNQQQVFDVSDLARNMFDDTDEDEGHRRWSLPPSGFTEEQKKQYQTYLDTLEAPKDLIDKFRKRRQLEKEKWEEFLADTTYVQSPKDKQFFAKVMLPALGYLGLQVMTYLSAYELGRS